jgi:hypothetical protein
LLSRFRHSSLCFEPQIFADEGRLIYVSSANSAAQRAYSLILFSSVL